MKPFGHLLRAFLLILTAALNSCALPPYQAWRVIRTEGFFPFLAMELGKKPFPSGYTPLRLNPSVQPPLLATNYIGATTDYAPLPPEPLRPPLQAPKPRMLPPRPDAQEPRRTVVTDNSDTPARPAPKKQTEAVKPKVTAAELKASEHKPVVIVEPKKIAPPAAQAQPSPKPAEGGLPYGSPIPGRPGLVNSPYASANQLVDVAGLKPGQEVKCPYSGKLFRVPPGAQASDNSKPAEAPAKQ